MQDTTPDYNFKPYITKSFIPVLCGNFYFTGAYIFYVPITNSLDAKTYAFQCSNSEPCFWYGSNWRNATPQELTDRFVSLVQGGKEWEPLFSDEYAIPFIQHNTHYGFQDELPPIDFDPVISSVTCSALPDAKQGEEYDQRLVFTTKQPDWNLSYRYVYSLSGDGSEGLVIDNDGNISGIPTAYGSVIVSVSVTDTESNNAVGTTTFNVTHTPNKINSVSASIDNTSATVGTAYTGKLTAVCSPVDDGTYSYSYSGSQNGLTIDSTGAISGTPTAAGTITFTVTVTDSYNTPKSDTASITVADAAPTVSVLTSATPNPINIKVGTEALTQFTWVTDDVDDGSYQYQIQNTYGNGTGAGYFWISTDGKTFSVGDNSKWYTNATKLYIGASAYNGNATAAGSVTVNYAIKDSVGSPTLSGVYPVTVSN
ncbi:TPA: putative Ig domain-containing protein [Enterobacter hormaechei]|nr:putative Ig domain-containing protein [Enterobacter hormaechei]